ncbi:MAG: alkaline phosphatase family protein [Phycisphaerales bacterium]
MSERAARRLLIVGWDAADWMLIDPLMERGAMPNLKTLVDGGVRAELRTLEPTLSPLLWTSIATGKTPDKHGILNFVEPNPAGEGIRTSTSTTRSTKALWNMLTQSGMRVHALGWYASHPAEPISGVCVSNMYDRVEPPPPGQPWPVAPGAVHGDEAIQRRIAAARIHPVSARDALVRALVPRPPTRGGDGKPDTRLDFLAREWARAKWMHAAALEVLAADAAAGRAWDAMLVFHDSIDFIGHKMMELRPPRMEHVEKRDLETYGEVMDRIYMRHDEWLGELLRAAGPETTVILLSDHGFYSDHRRPVIDKWRQEQGAALEARWHRPEGVIVLSGPGFQRGQVIAAPTLLDITPTALAALGLPVGADMDGRVIVEAFERAPAVEAIPSWDERPGEAGLHPPEMRQNPFEAQEALRQLVDLGYMPDLGDDAKAQLGLTERESKFNLATVFLTTRRPAQAIPLLRELAELRPDEPRYAGLLAQAMHATSDFAGAAAVLREHLARGQRSADAQILLAGALHAAGDAAGAAEMVAEIEREYGKHDVMALPIAQLLATQGRWADADRYFERAAAHDPRAPEIRVAMARSALAQGAHERAAERCLDATELQMALPEAHYLLGVSLAWLGDLDNARASLQHALKFQPGHVDAWKFLAALETRAGAAAAATAAATRAAELEATAGEAVRRAQPLPWGPERWSARHRSQS